MNDVRNLDNISFWDWFKSHGGSEQSMKRMWDPIGAYKCCALVRVCIYICVCVCMCVCVCVWACFRKLNF
jgi:hypothetical protein